VWLLRPRHSEAALAESRGSRSRGYGNTWSGRFGRVTAVWKISDVNIQIVNQLARPPSCSNCLAGNQRRYWLSTVHPLTLSPDVDRALALRVFLSTIRSAPLLRDATFSGHRASLPQTICSLRWRTLCFRQERRYRSASQAGRFRSI
jgi:hypothetical protein